MLKKQKIEFRKYFEKFDVKNENILRKYNHSLKVMDNAIEIAKTLNLSDEMLEIVGVAGLLHDIGRCEQMRKYNTYVDINSIDHAKLGVEILKKNDYIKRYLIDNKYI